MNWNIFKRLRAVEADVNTNMFINEVLRKRIDALEKSTQPAVVKTAAEKLTKAQAYRRAYYQKRKAAAALLKVAK